MPASPLLASLLVPLVALAARAQEPEPPSCCSEAEPAVLPPLPAGASPVERQLRALHETGGGDPANIFLSTHYLAGLRAQRAAVRDDAPLPERFGVRWTLAQALVRVGELDAAIDQLEQCVALCERHPDVAAGWLPEVLLRLGATWFRLAEKQNCIARHNAESCILPLSPRAVHVDQVGAKAAATVLTRLLALPQGDLRLEATWLLNIAHMALGDWPDGVPAAHRAASSAFAAEATLPSFHERGAAIGRHHPPAEAADSRPTTS